MHSRLSRRFHLFVGASIACAAAFAQHQPSGSPPFRPQPRQLQAASEAAADATLPSHVRQGSAPTSSESTTSAAGRVAKGQSAHGVRADAGGASSPADPRAMQDLQDAADHLREAIRALAQKSGPERQAALETAHLALMRTEGAMHALPARLRGGAPAGDEAYSRSVQQLALAADALRNSVQNLSRQTGGPQRNSAIQAANKALLDTQSAMASAYDASLPSKSAMGAPSSATSPAAQSSKQ